MTTEPQPVTVEELAGIIFDNPGCEILFIDRGWWIILPKGGNDINCAWAKDGDPLVEPLVRSEQIDHSPLQRTDSSALLQAMAFLLGIRVEDDY